MNGSEKVLILTIIQELREIKEILRDPARYVDSESTASDKVSLEEIQKRVAEVLQSPTGYKGFQYIDDDDWEYYTNGFDLETWRVHDNAVEFFDVDVHKWLKSTFSAEYIKKYMTKTQKPVIE